MIRHVLQPPGSTLCGQAVVAMIAGISLERSIEVFRRHMRNPQSGTHTHHVRTALKFLGIPCAPRLKRIHSKTAVPDRAILRVQYKDGSGHWMLRWDGHIYDPEATYPIGYEYHKITSYLEIGHE